MSRILFRCVTISVLILFNTACVYEQIAPVQGPESVSWNVDVLPILVNNCATSTCHTTGKISPDLTSENAYLNLTLFGYVNTTTPEESLIMQKLVGGSMKDQASESEKQIILKWIEQGALDD